MDNSRFDAITRAITTRLSRRTSLGLLAGLGATLALPEVTGAKKKPAKKITVCHKGKTIKIDQEQKKQHLKHGDTLGKCKALRCGAGGDCTVFITSATLTGAAVGGLAGGDAFCQNSAKAAGLSGTFKAWLSDSSASPSTRFTNQAKAGPYRLVANAQDGANPPPLVAASFSAMTACTGNEDCLQHAIDRTQTGAQLTARGVAWTSTNADGAATADTCTNWTSDQGNGVVGFADQNIILTSVWTNVSGSGCNTPSALYCFQQA